MKIVRRFWTFLCASVFLFSIGGVYALWRYWQPSDSANASGAMWMGEFYYNMEEVLPSDGAHDMNALGFVEFVIYDVKAGLNSKKGEPIFNQLKRQGDKCLHSKDNITNANFDHIFSTTESTALEFTMEYIDDLTIRLHVYLDEQLLKAEEKIEQAEALGTTVTVRITDYITLIQRSSVNSDWEAQGSAKGTAVVKDDGSFYVVDVSTWNGLEETQNT